MESDDSRESSVRYRYAIGANDAIVDVHSLTEMSRHQLGTLFCPGCGAELIPKLGQVVAKHFAHASESPCSGTSYLHKLAQRAFAISYRAALTRSAPFWLELRRPTRCTHFESAIGRACEAEEKTEVDLCAWFPALEVEKGHAGFVADILLQAPSGAVVFVEIAVTHRCEPEKIALGERIIEISIESEADIKPILEQRLDATTNRIRCYNFNPRAREGSLCGGQCDTPVCVMLVYRTGKSLLRKMTASELESTVRRSSLAWYKVIDGEYRNEDSAEQYKIHVREAFFEAAPVRNCYVCRYHGTGTVDEPIFCKLKKVRCRSNDAAECTAFKPFPDLAACEEADTANARYVAANNRRRPRRYDPFDKHED